MSAEHDSVSAAAERAPAAPAAAETPGLPDPTGLTLPAPTASRLLADPAIHGRGNGPVQRAAILQLQRTHGNQATRRLLHRAAPAPAPRVQRVETGTPVADGQGHGAATPPAADPNAADPNAADPNAADPNAADPNAAAPGRAPDRPVATTPALPQMAMSRNRAQAILERAYAQTYPIKKNTQLQLVAGRAEFDAFVDQIQIRRGVLDPDGKKWKQGTAAAKYTQRNQFIEGIADSDNNMAYVLKSATMPTSSVHELLHLNAATTWSAQVGNTLDEGMTETLAIKALRDTGIAVTDAEAAYATERALLRPLLMPLGGQGELRTAYFTGPAKIMATYAALPGKGSWKDLMQALDAKDSKKVQTILEKKQGL